MKTYQDLKSASYIEAMVPYAEALLGIRFTRVRKNRYSALCPFHADTQDRFMAYVNKEDEVRFHCFGACRGDWDIGDLIMMRHKYRFGKVQQIWAAQLGVTDFKPYDARSPNLSDPGETPEPDETVGFVEPQERDEKVVAALENAATFYNGLLISNEERFKLIWEHLARRGVGEETIHTFNIGYAPPFSDEQYNGRALTVASLPRFEKDFEAFKTFSDIGLVRFLNDATVKGYGYYCRQIDFRLKYPFARNYGDSLAGRMVFPIYDADARPIGFVGRRLGDWGVRWLKHQSREVPLSSRSWLYGIEKAEPYIRKYRTIILVEGLFDYFAFYNLLRDQDKLIVVSTLGSYLTPEAATILKKYDIKHYIVAYNWDELGRNGIERIAAKSGGWVYYLGGLAKDHDPYDMLKPVVSAISGFALNRKRPS